MFPQLWPPSPTWSLPTFAPSLAPDIDPFAEFEFSFLCEEFWWDEHDTSKSDYFSYDDDYSDTSSDEDSDSFTTTPSPTMIDTSFPLDFYLLSPITNPEPKP